MATVNTYELHYQGAMPDNVPDSHHVWALLDQLGSHLADAGMGLALFEQAIKRPRMSGYDRFQQRRFRVFAIAQALESQIPATLAPRERMEAIMDVHETADLQARREQWAAGQVPAGYEDRLPFIYAHTVVFALDNIGKTLHALAGMPGVPAGVATARDGYGQALPDLIDVRDTAHHLEDRARGLDRRRNPLVLQPVNNGFIHAPNGGFVGLGNLNHNRLGYTASDGHYREVEVSAQSVTAAQTAIQQALDAFSWRGPGRTAPL
jgi:hypothetical protein